MKRTADTVVIGAGVIGLVIATALAKRGLSVILAGEPRSGEASTAAAGMLAPSVERASGPAHDFTIAARNMYPDYLEHLADATGIRVPLNRLGILQVAITERGVSGLARTRSVESSWLDRSQLASLEPALGHALGAVLNPGDGAVDNVILMKALWELVERTPSISRVTGAVTAVAQMPSIGVATLSTGEKLEGAALVLAPGAWGGLIDGAPALSAVRPSRGQLISYEPIGLRHVTYGPRGYLVPRASGTTIAGSTMENAGFISETTSHGLAKVQAAAEEIAPALSIAKVTAQWAGLRPVTPDMLPIIGRDPANPRIIYACGHSRNGILMAPLTGETVASIVSDEPVPYDLSQFRPERFHDRFPRTHE
ncbi:MAG TPA: FAD-dependent oxidoreductase [Gemmatimonadaceae bacterium]|nr:FAD-dependent oxidoreductase [Gemmatimonadaceae bacterium]